jgi:hypothetical protein
MFIGIGRPLLLGRPEDVGELLDRGFELGGGGGVDVLLVLDASLRIFQVRSWRSG